MDAVGCNGFGSQDPKTRESVDHPFAVTPQAILHIRLSFGRMDMETGPASGVLFTASRERIVTEGKGGMEAKHASRHIVLGLVAMAEVSHVFQDTLIGDLPSIAVRNLIAQTGSDPNQPSCL